MLGAPGAVAVSELIVLCYHAISPNWSADLSVTPDAFERQITGLVRRGWAAATFTAGTRLTPPASTFVVTFDDAFASVKNYALPVLSSLGVRATVFAPTDYVSRRAPLAWDGLDHWQRTPDAAELTPMSWDDLGELAELGWEVASHTRTHPMLTSLNDEALTAELRDSRRECAQRLGRPVTSIAYPYGNFDARVREQTRAAGYEVAAALTWPARRRDRLQYPRIGVYHKDAWWRFRLKVGRWSRTSYAARLIALRAANVKPS
jgi:peptidoglycan/xylan/chitin deacetylase (PgdA/CDA1 family)